MLWRPRKRHAGDASTRRGFTLPEVLVTTAIIGTLATMSMASFSSIRVKARDLKRIADTDAFRTALELYSQVHGGYPSDRQAGPDGMPIGSSEYDTLSDAGFGKTAAGTVYMVGIPQNPVPFGVPYLYRSLNADGSHCDKQVCASFVILFSLEHAQAGLSAGAHVMTPVGPAEPKGFSPDALRPVGVSGYADVQAQVDSYVTSSTDKVVAVVNSEPVKKANELVVAPTVAVSTAANVVFSSSQFGGYLFFFLTQPALLFGMRRRKNWGVVFNSVTHMPIDLAIVRLRRNSDGRIAQSTVTDAEGRYSFLTHPGSYRIEVSKAGIVFPSVVDMSVNEDGHYHDLYHGGRIDVHDDATILTNNIPVDPDGMEQPDAVVLKEQSKKMLHKSFALISPVLGGIVFVMRPSPFVGLLFAAEIVLYFLFKRLAQPPEPKNWGTVFHQVTEEPVPKAVVRIFSARFNKLLETQVTDIFGRYHFRVMDNVYYLTVTKEGFRKTETEPIDLVGSFTPIIIASDLPLSPVEGALIVATKKKPADDKPKKSMIVGPQAYGAKTGGPNAPSLPASLMGDAEPVKKPAEKPYVPLVAPAVPDVLKGTHDEAAPKKKVPVPLSTPVVPEALSDGTKGPPAVETAPPPAAVPPMEKPVDAPKSDEPDDEPKEQPPKSGAWHRDL